jgi:hypothetical protein
MAVDVSGLPPTPRLFVTECTGLRGIEPAAPFVAVRAQPVQHYFRAKRFFDDAFGRVRVALDAGLRFLWLTITVSVTRFAPDPVSLEILRMRRPQWSCINLVVTIGAVELQIVRVELVIE